MEKTPPLQTYLTVESVSRLAGCHRETVARLIASGRIQAAAYLDRTGTVVPLLLPETAILVALLTTPAPLDTPPRIT
jgi:excisionase family DNA binding protein